MKKTKIILGLIVLIAVAGLVWALKGSGKQEVSKLDTIDTVGSFYNPWLNAVQHPDQELSRETLAKTGILSKELREKLKTALKDSTNKTDPVLCESVVPMGINMRSVFSNDTEAQVLVTSKDKTVYDSALVLLAKLDGGWYIKDIECSGGEVAPEKEFTFENTGYLLKGSIPKPYDNKKWHLVYEENGQKGNVIPLIFTAKSECKSLDGKTSSCTPDKFTEATKVSIKGQMTELGAEVQKLEFVKEE